MDTTVDLSTADIAENSTQWRSAKTAAKYADLYAGMASANHDEPAKGGEVFETRTWNGSQFVPIWLYYGYSAIEDGWWVVTSYRWYTDPRTQEA